MLVERLSEIAEVIERRRERSGAVDIDLLLAAIELYDLVVNELQLKTSGVYVNSAAPFPLEPHVGYAIGELIDEELQGFSRFRVLSSRKFSPGTYVLVNSRSVVLSFSSQNARAKYCVFSENDVR